MNSVQTDRLLNRMIGKREFYVQQISLANIQAFPEPLCTEVASSYVLEQKKSILRYTY